MVWIQKEIVLPSHRRGYHIITHHIRDEFKDELKKIKVGMIHIFIKVFSS